MCIILWIDVNYISSILVNIAIISLHFFFNKISIDNSLNIKEMEYTE